MSALCTIVGVVSGLPDGIFLNQKLRFWYTFEGIGIEYFGIYYDQFVFKVIWCI
jgi:hypothetical protein